MTFQPTLITPTSNVEFLYLEGSLVVPVSIVQENESQDLESAPKDIKTPVVPPAGIIVNADLHSGSL